MALFVVVILLLVVVPGLIYLVARVAAGAGKRRVPFASYPDEPAKPKPGETP